MTGMPETKTKIYSLSLPNGWQSIPEISVLKSGENGPLFLLAYLSLLEASAPHSGLLVLDSGLAYTETMLPPLIGFGSDKSGNDLCQSLVSKLTGLGLMAKDEMGRLYLPKAGEMTRGEFNSSIARRIRRNENLLQIEVGTDIKRTSSGHQADIKRTSSGHQADIEKDPSAVSLNGPFENSLNLSYETKPSIPPYPPKKELSETVPLGEMTTKRSSELSEDLRNKANETAKWYPKKTFGIIGSVYEWFYENKPNDKDMESIKKYFQICISSPEWKDRLAQDPGFRYLPSVVNFLNSWLAWRGISDAIPGNQKAAEEKELEEKINSNPLAFISSVELMKREYEGTADEDEIDELNSRRDDGSITKGEISEFEAYRQEREELKIKHPPKTNQSAVDGGFKTPSDILGDITK